jgi:hypothetical protein
MLHGVKLGEVLPPGGGSLCRPAKRPLHLIITLSMGLYFNAISVLITVRVNLNDSLLEFVGE